MPKKSVDALEVELAESLHLKEREALITECENQCKTIMKIVTSDILSQGRACPLGARLPRGQFPARSKTVPVPSLPIRARP